MKSHQRVVVIGGGVVGVATLYHLARKGWRDVTLLERRELTSGSTWHAAGLLPLFNMSYAVGRMHRYSLDLYKRLEAETGLDVGLRQVSNIRLALTQDRLDEYQQYAGVARSVGVDLHFLSAEELGSIWPLCQRDDILAAIQHPQDGYIQPADLTQALAAGARAQGAEIIRNTTVTAIRRRPSGEWEVSTDKGSIVCEHVVSATGNFARQTGRMVGLDIPVMPMEHQYIVTDAHPLLVERREAGLPELGILRVPDGSWYVRQEGDGLILGIYEKGAPACYLDGPDDSSEYELFQEDMSRLEPYIDACMARVPIFAECGVKKVYNGAIAYTPDGNPIIGPAWDLPNFWLNEGHSFGITAAGGAGWQLAEWIVEGEPTIDMLAVDPRRYGDHCSRDYLIRKAEDTYAHVFAIHYPDEHRPAGRPLKQPPCHQKLKDLGAVFGEGGGWERPLWFAPRGVTQEDSLSFRRAGWFPHALAEARNVAKNVGLLDMTAFAKCRLSGPGAEGFLDHYLANTLPEQSGQIRLCHALNTRGGVQSEFTVIREPAGSFYCVSAAALQRLDHDRLAKHMPDDGSVIIENVTGQTGVLVLAGPKSRQLLQRVSDCDFSNASFPWLTARQITIGGLPVLAARLNFVGELGWELHHPIEGQNRIFELLWEAGEDLGLAPFGLRAQNMLRIEKSYRMIGTELSIEYSAIDSGLTRFINLHKDFIGRDALLAQGQKDQTEVLATLAIEGETDADALGNNPVYLNGDVIGRTTSGAYGARLCRSLALAMIPPELARPGIQLQLDILGNRLSCMVQQESPYDPANTIPRS